MLGKEGRISEIMEGSISGSLGERVYRWAGISPEGRRGPRGEGSVENESRGKKTIRHL